MSGRAVDEGRWTGTGFASSAWGIAAAGCVLALLAACSMQQLAHSVRQTVENIALNAAMGSFRVGG